MSTRHSSGSCDDTCIEHNSRFRHTRWVVLLLAIVVAVLLLWSYLNFLCATVQVSDSKDINWLLRLFYGDRCLRRSSAVSLSMAGDRDQQQLTLSGTSLTLSGGNTIDLTSLVGATGPTGANGSSGSTGAPGAPGATGPAGPTVLSNTLVNDGINLLTSTVNGLSSSAGIVNTNSLGLVGSNITSAVNGLVSMPINIASFDCSGSTTVFCQGGNSFGATGILGTNDANDLAFETAGSTKMSIDTIGRVGIGTTAPQAGLDVQNSADAALGLAIGTNLTQTLTATANNDELIGLYIDPIMSTGGFSDIDEYGLVVDNSQAQLRGSVNTRTITGYPIVDVLGLSTTQTIMADTDFGGGQRLAAIGMLPTFDDQGIAGNNHYGIGQFILDNSELNSFTEGFGVLMEQADTGGTSTRTNFGVYSSSVRNGNQAYANDYGSYNQIYWGSSFVGNPTALTLGGGSAAGSYSAVFADSTVTSPGVLATTGSTSSAVVLSTADYASAIGASASSGFGGVVTNKATLLGLDANSFSSGVSDSLEQFGIGNNVFAFGSTTNGTISVGYNNDMLFMGSAGDNLTMTGNSLDMSASGVVGNSSSATNTMKGSETILNASLLTTGAGAVNTYVGSDYSIIGNTQGVSDDVFGIRAYVNTGTSVTGAQFNVLGATINSVGVDIDTSDNGAGTTALGLDVAMINTGGTTLAAQFTDISSDTIATFKGASSTCSVDTLGGTLFCVSDAKLKDNIMSLQGSLDKVLALRGVTYNWKSDELKQEVAGFIAQEVEGIIPGLVKELADGTKTLDKTGMIPYLVEAIKTQNGSIEQINQQLSTQGITLESLSDEIKALAQEVQDIKTRLNQKDIDDKSRDDEIKQLRERLDKLEKGN